MLLSLSDDLIRLLSQEGLISGKLAKEGFSGPLLATLLATAWIQTGFCEELLFRGFVAKRLIARLGFFSGNVLQAIIFASVHVPFIFLLPEEFQTSATFMFLGFMPFVSSMLWCYINEKHAGGSIIPSWIMHGLGNTIAYLSPIL